MKTTLLRGLDTRDEQIFRANFASSGAFRKRMREIIDNEIKTVYTAMENADNYDSPNWAALQAGKIERIRALKQFKGWLEDE